MKRLPVIGLPVAATDYAGAVEWVLTHAAKADHARDAAVARARDAAGSAKDAAGSARFHYDQLPALADLLGRVQHLLAGVETRLRQDIAAGVPRRESE